MLSMFARTEAKMMHLTIWDLVEHTRVPVILESSRFLGLLLSNSWIKFPGFHWDSRDSLGFKSVFKN